MPFKRLGLDSVNVPHNRSPTNHHRLNNLQLPVFTLSIIMDVRPEVRSHSEALYPAPPPHSMIDVLNILRLTIMPNSSVTSAPSVSRAGCSSKYIYLEAAQQIACSPCRQMLHALNVLGLHVLKHALNTRSTDPTTLVALCPPSHLYMGMQVSLARKKYSVKFPTLYADATNPNANNFNCVQVPACGKSWASLPGPLCM